MKLIISGEKVTFAHLLPQKLWQKFLVFSLCNNFEIVSIPFILSLISYGNHVGWRLYVNWLQKLKT